jgi:hypothetical protein
VGCDFFVVWYTGTDISEKSAASFIRVEDPFFYPEDGGRRFPQNIGTCLPDYTHRRL